ncbi:sensor domain-containing diguanylate cyclase [Undibacterium sp. 5I1]|uniref:sensor domain-containing diguanylate cyclase n=1 Tax=unclassified Undibacterium TaxID=2630295 RepID=UPI002AB35D58|nr:MULTISPECIES: sensor domain-containing diguanylate cyclase [unclassified Undibacterium]MDY7540018.1 sensor domain-containing diguanylate cyclase [Undibacterium sp. 5I1]MEB0232476.1 sensor domain-containing diguanylate cyclase [Undibacterium sp. 10I3]MEB0257865.1 sensor domain-containing diguanylate cyclase [Undibacterium sp. 5I1]
MAGIDNSDSLSKENSRIAALRAYEILDTQEEDEFTLLVKVAAEICNVPYAFISLVDKDRVWHKSAFGSAPQESARTKSYCSRAIQQDKMLVIPDISEDERTNNMHSTARKDGFGMYSGANLITPEGFRIGTLCVLDTKPKTLTEKQLELLLGLARQAMALIELRKRTRDLNSAMIRLQQIANEDVLTGLATRRSLLNKLQIEVDRSKRFSSELTVVMVDLDHFKQINDRYDHAMGDAVLREIGSLIRSNVRSVDIAGRYGGEEFCIVLPRTDLVGGLKFAETLRMAMSEKIIKDNGVQIRVTASFGVATSIATNSTNGEELIRAADTALYEAKHLGRNRVVGANGERQSK